MHVDTYPTTPWYETERDLWETGEPPVRSHHVFAEHMNTLAQSGITGVYEIERRPVAWGRTNTVHKHAAARFTSVTTDEIEEARSREARPSFDEMYRRTQRRIRLQRQMAKAS